jgi:hypothetical protein
MEMKQEIISNYHYCLNQSSIIMEANLQQEEKYLCDMYWKTRLQKLV